MSSIFHQLSRPALEGLADVLARWYLRLPCPPAALVHTVPSTLSPQIASALNRLEEQGMQEQHLVQAGRSSVPVTRAYFAYQI